MAWRRTRSFLREGRSEEGGHVHSVTYRTLSGISVHSLSTRCVGSAEDIVSK